MSQSLSTSKPADPLVGMVVYDAVLHEMQVFTGVTWQTVNVDNPKYCVVCNKATHMIENNMIPDHPFCEDNLQYLEWQVEKRERSIR